MNRSHILSDYQGLKLNSFTCFFEKIGIYSTKPTKISVIFKTIDDYISSFPPGTQKILTQIRHTIAENAPEATEKISYNMPTFYLNGNLVHFAGYKNHIGFYPDPTAMERFEKELSPYITGKGSAQFPINEEIPLNLIGEIVRYRVNAAQQEVA